MDLSPSIPVDIAKASTGDQPEVCCVERDFALPAQQRKRITYDCRTPKESQSGKRERTLAVLVNLEVRDLGKQRQKKQFQGFVGSKFPLGARDLALHFDHDDKSYYAFLVLERGMS